MKIKLSILTTAAVMTMLQTANNSAQTNVGNPARSTLIRTVAPVQTTNPPYLREMPSAERVKAEIKGSDAMDTAARQAGAFWQLRQIIYDIALAQRRDRNEVTPDEKRLVDGYYADHHYASQPIEKSLSAEDKPKWFKLRSRYEVDPQFRDELFTRFFSPALRAEYFRATGEMDARIRARQEAEQKAFKDAQAAAKAQEAGGQTGYNDPGTIEARRCIESGRNPLECAGAAMGKGLNELLGIANPAVKAPVLPPGLYMHGYYANGSGFTVGFGRKGAALKCGDLIPDAYAYGVEMKGNQVLITVQTKPRPVVFSFRNDGRLVGPATAEILGRVSAGYNRVWTEQRRVSDNSVVPGSGAWENVPIYAPKLERCNLGVLASAGAPPPAEKNAFHVILSGGGALDNQAKTVSNAKDFKSPAGLRMNGQYTGQGGFAVQFNPDESAVFTCGDVDVAHSYTVEKDDARVTVKIGDDSTPVVLALRPDGALEGSGPVELRGRKVVGMRDNPATGSSEPVFAAKSASCTLGVLIPRRTETPGVAEAGAAAARERYNTSAPTAPNPAPAARPNSVPTNTTSPGATAVLSVESGFGTQSANPLSGQNLFLMRESLETALPKAGFRPPQGMSVIRGWVSACNAGQPICLQALTTAVTSAAGMVKADANGKAQFAAVPAGAYYVFAITRFNNQPTLWNLRVELKPGANSVNLRPSNAAAVDR